MPRSKREQLITLAKTTKKGKERKNKLIEEIHNEIESHNSVYVFSYENMRNAAFQDVRKALDGRFAFLTTPLV